MQQPTDFEQAVLEMTNRARMDPQGEFDEFIVNAASRTAIADNITVALDFFDLDLGVLRAQLADLSPAAPVAWSTAPEDAGEVQAVRHRTLPLWGLQFHPESLFSEHGPALLGNFLSLGRDATAP